MGLLRGKVRKCTRHGNAEPCPKCRAVNREAANYRAAQAKTGGAHTCGRRFPNGGTCYRTVTPHEPCPRH